MGIQINGQTDTISSTDGSLNIGGTVTVNVTGDATGLTGTPDITVGAVTASSATISGDLTVNGTTTTLDTTLTEVDKLEVGANNTTVGVAITQSGTGDILRLYDGATQVVTVKDGGSVGIGTDNPNGGLEVYNSNQAVSIVRGNKATLAILGDDSNSGASDTDARIILCSDGTIANSVSALTTSPLSNHGFEIALINEEPGSALRFHDGTANEERLRIDSSGRVLIGTTTEGEANADDLTVASSGHTGITIRSGTANRGNIYFSDGTSGDAEYRGYLEYNHDGDRFSIATANSTRLFIDSSGRVGINRTSPAYALDVKQTDTGNSNTVAAKGGTNGGGFFWEQNNGTTLGAAGYGNLITANSGSTNTAITTWGSQDLLLGTDRTERLRITSSGNIGIGTDNPVVKLHVVSSGVEQVRLSKNGAEGLEVFLGNNTDSNLFQHFNRTSNTWVENRQNALRHTFANSGNGNEVFRIESNGKVGISSATPNDLLDVYGGSICKTGTGSNYSPHVIVRDKNGRIRYFEYYFNTVKNSDFNTATDAYILDITNIGSFFQASFELVYGTRLQSVTQQVTQTNTKTFGVNRFNSGNVAVTDENDISVDSNSNTYSDVTMDALSSTAVRLKVAFSSSLGPSSFCSGVLRAWGVNDILEHESYQTLTFYNGV